MTLFTANLLRDMCLLSPCVCVCLCMCILNTKSGVVCIFTGMPACVKVLVQERCVRFGLLLCNSTLCISVYERVPNLLQVLGDYRLSRFRQVLGHLGTVARSRAG